MRTSLSHHFEHNKKIVPQNYPEMNLGSVQISSTVQKNQHLQVEFSNSSKGWLCQKEIFGSNLFLKSNRKKKLHDIRQKRNMCICARIFSENCNLNKIRKIELLLVSLRQEGGMWHRNLIVNFPPPLFFHLPNLNSLFFVAFLHHHIILAKLSCHWVSH